MYALFGVGQSPKSRRKLLPDSIITHILQKCKRMFEFIRKIFCGRQLYHKQDNARRHACNMHRRMRKFARHTSTQSTRRQTATAGAAVGKTVEKVSVYADNWIRYAKYRKNKDNIQLQNVTEREMSFCDICWFCLSKKFIKLLKQEISKK